MFGGSARRDWFLDWFHLYRWEPVLVRTGSEPVRLLILKDIDWFAGFDWFGTS